MATTCTTAKCESCGGTLNRVGVEIFGTWHDVACYGSCGCPTSAKRLEAFAPPGPMPLPSEHRCPMCGGGMELDGRTGYVSDCPWCGYSCVFGSDLTQRNAESAAERNADSGGVLAGTGVPPLYWDVEPDFALADEIVRGGKGLYIYGRSNGTRKTLTACAVARAFAERGASVRFVSSVKLLSSFRDAYGQNKPEGEVFDELNGCDLLVIDDMGKENPTSWAATMLYAVVDGRYGSRKPMVITTNFAEGELVARLARVTDESTARAMLSRIYERTEKLLLDGPDRRLS